MAVKGDVVKISGKTLKLVIDTEIDRGAQGVVYDLMPFFINEKKYVDYYVAKLYSSHLDEIKLTEIKNNFEYISDLFSKGKLYDVRSNFAYPTHITENHCGYLMRKVPSRLSSLSKLIQIPTNEDDAKNWFKEVVPLKSRYETAIKIVSIIDFLHKNNYVYSDISLGNIMGSFIDKEIVFIDTDNIKEVGNMKPVFGTPGFNAPELYSKEPTERANTIYSDIYSLAIVLFQILTFHHPFIGDEIENGHHDLETKAYKGETDYVLAENSKNFSSYFSIENFDLVVNKELRDVFYEMFVSNKFSPKTRPSAEKIINALAIGINKIITCKNCGTQNIQIDDKKCLFCELQNDASHNINEFKSNEKNVGNIKQTHIPIEISLGNGLWTEWSLDLNEVSLFCGNHLGMGSFFDGEILKIDIISLATKQQLNIEICDAVFKKSNKSVNYDYRYRYNTFVSGVDICVLIVSKKSKHPTVLDYTSRQISIPLVDIDHIKVYLREKNSDRDVVTSIIRFKDNNAQ